MQLISLKVDGFKCIQKARIELKPGLNILHGPNDLGKSTLAMAIRAVLLLMHDQKEHESFVPWSEDVAPTVELRFEMKEKGFYQVTKFFGPSSRGKSLLAWSKDGRDYAVTTKGREVDEELRKLLRWGVPAPGGKARLKGMPETFLTEVLMPNQSQVARVLEVSLEQDPHESGKEHLTQVLQALATDPVFKKVFATASAKVDEAYASTGQKKRGKGSPWAAARDRINEAQREVERLRADVVKSQDAENNVKLLSDRLNAQRIKLEESVEGLENLESRWATKQKRTALENELRNARAGLAEVESLFAAVQSTDEEIGSLGHQIESARLHAIGAKNAVEVAESTLHQALERKTRIESEAGEQARAVERSRIEKDQAEISTALARLSAEVERASEARRDLDALGALDARARKSSDRIEVATRERESARQLVAEAKASLDELEQLADLHRFLDATRQYEANEAAIEKARSSREKRARLIAAATDIEARLGAVALPTKAVLQSLRALKHKLDLSEAEVAGLGISLRPEQALDVAIATDDALEARERIESPRTLEARRSIRIVIAGVAELTAVAGRPEAREEAEDLGRRWKLEGLPVLQAAGVADLDALAAMIDDAARLRLDADALHREAASIGAAQQELRLRDAAELRRIVEEREVPLRGRDRVSLGSKLEKIGFERLDIEEAALRKKIDAASSRVSHLELELAKLRAELERDQASIRELQERLEPRLKALASSPADVLERAREKQRSLELLRGELSSRLAALEREAKTAIVDASAAVEVAQSTLQSAKVAFQRSEIAQSDLHNRLAAAGARLEERRRAAEAADRARHVARVSDLEAQLNAVLDDPSLTEEMIEQARSLVQREHQLAESIEDELYGARGALEHVGGSVVKELELEWDEALQLAQRDQQDLEVEYEAWRLLVEALRETEKDQAGHLGRALVEPISRRFAELTEGRYPRLTIGPNLEAQRIVAEGTERELGSLSVGTLEQLATIIRLCLAERLGTCLILDDQLSQSDPNRIGLVRELLYETANRIQIIVFTCRPDDYVRPGTGYTVVDLSSRMNRYGAKRVLPEGSTRFRPAST